MADSASSPATLPPNPQPSESAPPDPLPHSSTPPSSTPLATNPNSNPTLLPPPPTLLFPAGTPPQIPGVLPPSFRPLAPQMPQFSPVVPPNPAYQNPTVPPPGVGGAAAPVPHIQPMMSYQVPPGQTGNPTLRPFVPIPNGYAAAPQGTMTPAGIPRYPPPYGTMVRPVFPPRPPGAVNILPVSRPPVAGIPAVRPIIPPVVRPMIAPSVTPAEKPQNTVYIGKIAPTVENEFMLSLLQLCGTIKTWKRPQDLSTGTPTSFGFYEFESAEGVLRALRLLTKLNIDGQELKVNVNQAMKEHLERYVQKKTENLKNTETQAGVVEKDEGAQPSNANEEAKADTEPSNKDDNESANKESHDVANFGIVTDEDREADREALEKITKMIEERLKTRPLPTPPAQPTGDGFVTSDQPVKTRDGDSIVDTEKNESAENKNERETSNDNKPTSEHDRPESPDRRHDRKSRERDRDRELKREKERELERYEREAERERVRKEREQRRRVEEAERQYEAYLKDWEYREREKEKERQYEKEKEKERERKRRKEIVYDEEDEDEDSRKRWRRSVIEEKRKKRLREKEDDLTDRQKEEEEIAEAKKEAEEELKRQRDALKLLSEHVVNNGGNENIITEEITNEVKIIVAEQDTVADYSREDHIGSKCFTMAGDGNSLNVINDESTIASVAPTDTQSSGNAPIKKLGFGLVGSGKRTTVPSVFHEEDDDDAHKDKKLRPLVPIDYSTEELQAVQPTVSGPTPPNLAAAAEFAKRISSTNFKEEKLDGERDRSRRSNEKSSHRDRDRSDEDGTHNRDENKERIPDRDRDRDHGSEKLKTSDNKRLLDAKQLIDMIPKTKEELFSYEIDWTVYDKSENTQEHVKALQMLERLQIILDEEAEMFVLKMWRMLIFEIKKVETGLALSSCGELALFSPKVLWFKSILKVPVETMALISIIA
ncbi:RNA-binding protein 25, partial [Mucuna pruriens]